MLIATTNELAGYEIEEVFGEVFGLTVRSRNIGSQIGASLKSILGGELQGMTKALAESREQVIERMVQEAEAKGGNAIVAMRFDTSEMGPNWTEICAYGTAMCVRGGARFSRMPRHGYWWAKAMASQPAPQLSSRAGSTVSTSSRRDGAATSPSSCVTLPPTTCANAAAGRHGSGCWRRTSARG